MAYLITGRSGSGKTWLAQRAAYLMCVRQVSFGDVENHLDEISPGELKAFLDSERYLHVQVTSVSTFEDLVSGMSWSTPQDQTNASLKPLGEFFRKAANRNDQVAVVFDDLDRADPDTFMGPLLSVLSNRAFPLRTSAGVEVSIPEGVRFFFTSAQTKHSTRLPTSLLANMSGTRAIPDSPSFLEKYYSDTVHKRAREVAVRLMLRTNAYIKSERVADSVAEIDPYLLGHGYFIADIDRPIQSILDALQLKYRYIVAPLLLNYWRENIIEHDPSSFLRTMIVDLEGELQAESEISGVEKIYLRTREPVPIFTSDDSKAYIATSLSNSNNRANARDVIEAIIDALTSNGLLPIDLVFTELLNNPQVGWVENERRPGDRASYLLPETEADGFVYLTPRQGSKIPHNFFSTGSTKGRNKEHGPSGYRYSYKRSRNPVVYIPLNGFRKKSIRIDEPKLYDDGNAAVAFRSCYRLVDAYLELLAKCYRIMSLSVDSYKTLAQYVQLEISFHRGLFEHVRTHFAGEELRFYRYCQSILDLRSLWAADGSSIEVGSRLYDQLKDLDFTSFEDFEKLHGASDRYTRITFREVQLMAKSEDYQAVMDSLGVRQLIFQGPPGTSKTFESKRFVLRQLNPEASCLGVPFPSRQDIDLELADFKMSSTDYENIESSPALKQGGWDIVQFHPAYSYEDFIRGIRVSARDGLPIYETVNRIFGNIAAIAKAAAEVATISPAPKFYLIVDEINRADLASVFGELIYGLEYRGSKMTTPYAVKSVNESKESYELEVTENVYLIGTMNTADKSIGTLDYAIRRRFLFIDSPADRNTILSAYQAVSGNSDELSIEILLFDAVQFLFDSPEYFNDDYHRNDVRIGHTFFLRSLKQGFEEQIADRIAFQIVPILREYVRDGILNPLHVKDETISALPLTTIDYSATVSHLAQEILYFATTLGDSRDGVSRPESVMKEWVVDTARVLGL